MLSFDMLGTRECCSRGTREVGAALNVSVLCVIFMQKHELLLPNMQKPKLSCKILNFAVSGFFNLKSASICFFYTFLNDFYINVILIKILNTHEEARRIDASSITSRRLRGSFCYNFRPSTWKYHGNSCLVQSWKAGDARLIVDGVTTHYSRVLFFFVF